VSEVIPEDEDRGDGGAIDGALAGDDDTGDGEAGGTGPDDGGAGSQNM
jgi:hypothetical protein